MPTLPPEVADGAALSGFVRGLDEATNEELETVLAGESVTHGSQLAHPVLRIAPHDVLCVYAQVA